MWLCRRYPCRTVPPAGSDSVPFQWRPSINAAAWAPALCAKRSASFGGRARRDVSCSGSPVTTAVSASKPTKILCFRVFHPNTSKRSRSIHPGRTALSRTTRHSTRGIELGNRSQLTQKVAVSVDVSREIQSVLPCQPLGQFRVAPLQRFDDLQV